MQLTNTYTPAISELEQQVIDAAQRGNVLPESCDLIDYHHDYGRVAEHWRAKPSVMVIAIAVAKPNPTTEDRS